MTKYLSAVVLVATIVVAACSGGGSGTGAPPPITTVPVWAITSFAASDTNPFIGSVVVISAAVTKDGAAAPDGTTVEISVTYDGNEVNPEFGLGSIGTTTHRLVSSGGTVTTSLVANTEGPYALSAKVKTASDTLTVTYKFRDPSNSLQIYQPLLPNRGSLNGGEQVILQGKGIIVPVEVDFEVDAETYPAIIDGVQESQPLTADGSITIRTPYISDLTDDQRNQDWPSNVTVKVGLSTADEQTEILPGAFLFLAGPSGPQSVLPEPSIYLVIPDHGQSAGGQQVTILGRYFRATVTDTDGTVTDTPVAVDSVTFGGIEAIVLSVSADGTQIVVQTPRWSIIPLATDQPVDVVVETSYDTLGPFTVTLANGFVYLADEPTPEITGLAPTGGPIDGGEQVTIFGHGFQAPAQVTFGVLEAINVEVTDDQTLADQDTIVCVTPNYSQQNEEPPVAVDVVVRNILTGKVSAPATYTYGDNLYISGNTPVEGGPGDNIIIYGSGFEAPLQVDFGDIRLDVLSVSGTEILVRMPVDTPPSCTSVTGSFTVTLLESDLSADGGAFTFLGSNPQIFGVDPIFVEETGGGPLTITGEYFNPDLIVAINNYRLLSSLVTVTGTTQIDVATVPNIDLIGLTWDTSACVDGSGLLGVRIVPTPVDVTVTNLPGECSDTLAGGLVYEPLASDCFVGLTLSTTAIDFGSVDVDASDSRTLTVTNNGSVAVNMLAPTSTHPAFSTTQGFIVLSPGDVVPFNVTFAPTAGDIVGGADTDLLGTLSITATGSGLPNLTTTVDLSGTAHPFPIIGVAGTLPIGCAAGNTCTADITVNNIGTADLTWTEVIVGDVDLSITASTGAVAVPPGGSGTITVQLDASGAAPGETFNATVTITAVEGDEPNSPVAVDVTGTVS